jgi:NAD(P)-dependent dehydrogenase (short-subunit alcohol dehydrogenase family)
MELKERVCIITGAAGGIGQAAARRFHAEGARLMLVDLDPGPLGDVARSIGPDVAWCQADVTQPEQVKRYVDETVARFGRIDGFLNNAGIEGVVAPITESPIEMFDRVMAVNVRGVWLGLKYVMAEMQKQRRWQHRHHLLDRWHQGRARPVALCHQQTCRGRHDAQRIARRGAVQNSGSTPSILRRSTPA